MDLSEPAGLFKILVKNDGYDFALQHFSSANAPSSVVQYSYHMKNFIADYFNCHKEDCLEAFPEVSAVALEAHISRIEKHLQNVTAGGKRDLRHDRHVRQEVSTKEANQKIPKIANYRQVVEETQEFFRKACKNFHNRRRAGTPLWDKEGNVPDKNVQRMMWSARVNFIFNSDAQRANQYSEILIKEFFAVLLEKAQDQSGALVFKERDKECLDGFHKSPSTIAQVNAFKAAMEKDPDKHALQIWRIPHKINKRVRDKDTLWCRWNLCNQKLVMFAVHFCLILLPELHNATCKHGKPFDPRHLFHHTKKLHPLKGIQVCGTCQTTTTMLPRSSVFSRCRKTLVQQSGGMLLPHASFRRLT